MKIEYTITVVEDHDLEFSSFTQTFSDPVVANREYKKLCKDKNVNRVSLEAVIRTPIEFFRRSN